MPTKPPTMIQHSAPGRKSQAVEPSEGVWKYMLAGAAAVVLLVVGAGGWAATTSISGAVIAQGVVVVESNVKKVQHPTGGVVGLIKVKEGERVKAGDLLIRLDDTVTRANLQIITKQLDELAIRKARLLAERDGRQTMSVPQLVAGRTKVPDIAEILEGERRLLISRRKTGEGQKAQLRNQIVQLGEEIRGLEAQQRAKAEEVALIQTELAGLLELQLKNLVPRSRITAMRREATRIEGERARLLASAAQARGKIAQTELQILQLDQEHETEVIKEIRDIQAKAAELGERRIAAQDQLRRIDIRAPQSGLVHNLAVHTVGGVISQSEPLMLIVPQDDKLVIEARVAPEDIANVRLKQTAFIRFPAFNQRTTPEFNGEVTRVGADLTTDPRSDLSYYTARITLPASEMERLGDLKLLPGMPAEIHLKTSERTALSYLLRPLKDQMNRVFKKD